MIVATDNKIVNKCFENIQIPEKSKVKGICVAIKTDNAGWCYSFVNLNNIDVLGLGEFLKLDVVKDILQEEEWFDELPEV